MGTGMSERAVRFGDEGRLVGILTEPSEQMGDGTRVPALVLLNSGMLHRVGASRLHVTLARALAAEGFATLRFDFSGIGDSDVRRDSLGFRESAVLETRQAMDFLERVRGNRRFVLGGLCSGADTGFWTAGTDARVTGLIQLDGFAYPTPRFHVVRVVHRLSRPLTWPGWAGARAASLLTRGRALLPGARSAGRVTDPTPSFPPRDEVLPVLADLIARDIALYLFFSGGHRPYLNHPGQYARSFPEIEFGDRLTIDVLGEADHTVTDLAHQRFLTDRILRWTRKHWPRTTPRQAGSPGALAPG